MNDKDRLFDERRPQNLWLLRGTGRNIMVINNEGEVKWFRNISQAIGFARQFGIDLELKDGRIIHTDNGIKVQSASKGKKLITSYLIV